LKNFPFRFRTVAVVLTVALLLAGFTLLPSAGSVSQNALEDESDTGPSPATSTTGWSATRRWIN
jgi:hypothetical protein